MPPPNLPVRQVLWGSGFREKVTHRAALINTMPIKATKILIRSIMTGILTKLLKTDAKIRPTYGVKIN